MTPVSKDSDAQSTLSFVSVLPERFLSEQGLVEKKKARNAKNLGLWKKAYQFVFNIVDRILQTTSANSVN